MSRTSYILQNICYYLGTYKIGIYEIQITQKNDWSNYYLDLSDELAIKMDLNRKWFDMKWLEMAWKCYHDEIWHIKEEEETTSSGGDDWCESDVLRIDCNDGDLLLIDTCLWWHRTDIPSQPTPSVSYARDFFLQEPKLAVSTNSFHGNYYFLNSAYVLWPLVTIHKSEETIQGWKLLVEIRYIAYSHLPNIRAEPNKQCHLLLKGDEFNAYTLSNRVGHIFHIVHAKK